MIKFEPMTLRDTLFWRVAGRWDFTAENLGHTTCTMIEPPIRRFKDPRNALGLVADVIDLTIKTVEARPLPYTVLATDAAQLHTVRDLSRAFAKSPKTVLGGATRKGHSALYQQAKQAQKNLVEADYRWHNQRQDFIREIRGLCLVPYWIIHHTMEDMDRWYGSKGWIDSRPNGRNPPVYVDQHKINQISLPPWSELWAEITKSTNWLQVDNTHLATLEAEWQWRDITERSHRGQNIRAAFEAAWLCKHYDFAIQLLKGQGLSW